jgi:methylated-DNA-[protein]-cysteine S-methyltransferase
MTFGALTLPSPFGPLTLFAAAGKIVALEWGQGATPPGPIPEVLSAAKDQLAAYFDRRLTAFDLPLDPAGTDFQKRVWATMRAIPFGQVRPYGDVAAELKTAPRAVGGACGANPIPILIPCHRIVGGNGQMGGYSGDGGIATKTALLRLENAAI